MHRVLLVSCISLLFAPTGASADAPGLIPPVDAVVERPFAGPEVVWGSGHRGIDYAVETGTAVRAAGPGTVKFAGPVAGALAVTIDHGNGVETTYSFLSEVLVASEATVSAGTWIGRAGEAHPGEGGGLHFGTKVEGGYVDPADHLVALDVGDAVSLVPVAPENARPRDGSAVSGRSPGPCRERGRLSAATRPPNGNVAVAVAGIGSHTQGDMAADMYEHGPELLGYPENRIYRYSYRGTDGPDLHEPYVSEDTHGDLVSAARRLRDQMREIARLHPGAAVDLIAHSQGGVVARAYLQLVAERWGSELPPVEHLVTFSTPHEGAPLAGAAEGLAEDTVVGGPFLRLLSKVVDVLPEPRSEAVTQLAPGSDLMRTLAAEDLPFGTRALTLAIPHDAVVPADRTDIEGSKRVVVSPRGLNGHSSIVSSSEARALAFSFLAGGADPCKSTWDTWGPRLGWLVSSAEGSLPALFRGLEHNLLGPAAGLLGR
jgi:pimeloyl-ACP methyl ester carboxylesterase